MTMTKPGLLIVILAGIAAAVRAASQPGSDASPEGSGKPSASDAEVQPLPETAAVNRLIEWDDLEPGKGPVYGQDWSPDGRLIATADTDVVRLWDHDLRREIGVLAGHSDFIRDVAWSPAGEGMLASCSQDGSLRLWDAEALAPLAAIETGAANCLAWEPSGRRLVVGTQSGELQIWQTAEQERLLCWTNSSYSPILSLDWSSKGRMIACGDQEGVIYLLDAGLGELAQIFSDQTPVGGPVNGLAWSPEGQVLVSTHPDGRVRWWDYPSGRLVRTIQAHEGWARGLAWSPDGRLLATTGEDKHIRLWEASSGRPYAQEKHNFLPVWSCSWSPNGKQVASGAGAFNQAHSGATVVWDVP